MKRKLPLILLGIVVLAAAGLFTVKTMYESKVRNGIEKFLASLPAPLEVKAGNIDVSFFDKSVTISDLTGNYKSDNDTLTFSLAKLAATGVNADAAKEGAGVTDIAKTLSVDNAVYTSKLISGKIGRYEYKNISGDLRRIIDESVKAFPVIAEAYADPEYATSQKEQLALLRALTPLLAAAESLVIGGIELTDYSYTLPLTDGKNALVAVGTMSAGKYSVREMGAMALNNITCTMEGTSTPILQIEFLGMDGAEMPSFVKMFEAMSEGMTSSAILRTHLKGQKFALRNLNVKNLSVRNPEKLDETFLTVADAAFSYVAETSHELDLRFDGIKIAKKVLEEADGELPNSVLALLPATISYSSAVQIKATDKAGNGQAYDLECKKIAVKEDTLGEFSMSFSVTDLNSMALMMGMPGPAALKGFDLTAKDTGASDVFFTAMAEKENEDGVTAESLRADAIKKLPADADLPNDALRGLVSAVRAFIEAPGNTLRVTLAPAAALNLQALQGAILADPDKLGLSVSTTPAQ